MYITEYGNSELIILDNQDFNQFLGLIKKVLQEDTDPYKVASCFNVWGMIVGKVRQSKGPNEDFLPILEAYKRYSVQHTGVFLEHVVIFFFWNTWSVLIFFHRFFTFLFSPSTPYTDFSKTSS